MRECVGANAFVSALWVMTLLAYLAVGQASAALVMLGVALVSGMLYMRLMRPYPRVFLLTALVGVLTLGTAISYLEGRGEISPVLLVLALAIALEAAGMARHRSNAPRRRYWLYFFTILLPVFGSLLGLYDLRRRKPA